MKNLSYSYEDGTVALKNISLSINEGEHVAILGPNGAGKSTLLKLISGLIFPNYGNIRIFGNEVNKKSSEALHKKVGILFQDPDDQLFMPRVWDDIAFGPLNLGLTEPEINTRVEWALNQTDLTGYEERSPHHLSYGEKKRVAIAGLLAMKPNILLLDEFTANLDPRGQKEIIKFIKQLKTTIIFVTHDVNTAIKMATKVFILNKTSIESGSLKEIFSNDQLLRKSHLEIPEITQFFIELKKIGFKIEELPYTIEHAIQILKQTQH